MACGLSSDIYSPRPGVSIDKRAVAMFIQDLTTKFNVQAMAFDNAMMDDLLREFDEIGVDSWIDDAKAPNREGRAATCQARTGLRRIRVSV